MTSRGGGLVPSRLKKTLLGLPFVKYETRDLSELAPVSRDGNVVFSSVSPTLLLTYVHTIILK